jgi:hypothetical protein
MRPLEHIKSCLLRRPFNQVMTVQALSQQEDSAARRRMLSSAPSLSVLPSIKQIVMSSLQAFVSRWAPRTAQRSCKCVPVFSIRMFDLFIATGVVAAVVEVEASSVRASKSCGSTHVQGNTYVAVVYDVYAEMADVPDRSLPLHLPTLRAGLDNQRPVFAGLYHHDQTKHMTMPDAEQTALLAARHAVRPHWREDVVAICRWLKVVQNF